jgi:TolA-binding protein
MMAKTRIVYILLIAGIVFSGLLGYLGGQSSARSGLQASLNALQSGYDSLFNQVANLQGQVTSLRSQRGQLQEQVGNLTQQLTQNNQTMTDLQEQVAFLDANSNMTYYGPYFGPDGPCRAQVIAWIDRANTSLHVLMYNFTENDTGAAVLRAYQRGVDVKTVFELDQVNQYSEYEFLRSQGVAVRTDTNPHLMHKRARPRM